MEGFSVNTVDTTGAGDAFVGALLLQISKDPSIFQVPYKTFPTFFTFCYQKQEKHVCFFFFFFEKHKKT